MAALYDPNNPSNDLCQLGLNVSETSAFKSLLNTFLATYAASFTQPVRKMLHSNNRKLATVAIVITCNVLNKMGLGMVALNVSQLQSISSSEFYACRAVLGSSSNSWSGSQLTALASITKSVFKYIFIKSFISIVKIKKKIK